MSAPVDRPLSTLDSLRGLLAAFRLMDLQLGIDLAATTVHVRVASPGAPEGTVVLSVRLVDLLDRADSTVVAAEAADRLAQANRDVPGEHSPLPWTVCTDPEEPLTLLDALGTRIYTPEDWGIVPTAEARANIALVARAVSTFPFLLAALNSAVHALRLCERGEAGPTLAREAADACAVVVAQVEGR